MVRLWEAQIVMYLRVFFFFQAEDGIRDSSVTGVQTCALPISKVWSLLCERRRIPGSKDQTLARPAFALGKYGLISSPYRSHFYFRFYKPKSPPLRFTINLSRQRAGWTRASPSTGNGDSYVG